MNNQTSDERIQKALTGLLLGTAVGDSLRLPAEGLTRLRQSKWWTGRLRHRFLFGRGMVSDDTEHAVMTAVALGESKGDAVRFQRVLAGQMKWWFLSLPAGVGLATARACLRLLLGISPTKSGVYSAGNGPAMRSAIIGAFLHSDAKARCKFVSASTRITHTDPRADVAAQAVEETAAWMTNQNRDEQEFLVRLASLSSDKEWEKALVNLSQSLRNRLSVADFSDSLGLSKGVSGYAYHTVPVAIYATLRHRGDFESAVSSAIRCGGDTDTVGAITGALTGCATGQNGIPKDWLDGVNDWPISKARLIQVSHDLADGLRPGSMSHLWVAAIPRNMMFLIIVLFHGARRLFPPY